MHCLYIRSILLLCCLTHGIFAASTDAPSSTHTTSSASTPPADHSFSSAFSTSDGGSVPSPHSTLSHTIAIPSIISHHFSVGTRPHIPSTNTFSHVTIHRPPATTFTGTAPPMPPPTHTGPPHRSSRPMIVVIVFATLGGVAGLAVIFSVLRCLRSYGQTPRRDRIASILHRHQIQREMEELERNVVRRPSIRQPPPPPYVPRPPSYTERRTSTSPPPPTTPAGYSQVGSQSPPSSPANSVTDLPAQPNR